MLHARPLAAHVQHRRQRAVWLQKAILIAVIVRFGKRIRENVSLNVTQHNIFGMQDTEDTEELITTLHG